MNSEALSRCRTVYPLPSSPSDLFKWGAQYAMGSL